MSASHTVEDASMRFDARRLAGSFPDRSQDRGASIILRRGEQYLQCFTEQHGACWTDDPWEAWHTKSDNAIAQRIAARLGAAFVEGVR